MPGGEVTDPAVWLAYARAALGGALKGQELEAELERLRYDEAPRLLPDSERTDQ